MAQFNRSRSISLTQQKIELQKLYPNLIDRISISHNELKCEIRLQPTTMSRWYKVRVSFKLGYLPSVRLLEPKVIARFAGKKPHHLYNRGEDGNEKLCVFYPEGHEWNDNKFLADAFIPWVITWLSAYEIWQITGVWVYPEFIDNKPKQETGK